jgi:hypothetical protein
MKLFILVSSVILFSFPALAKSDKTKLRITYENIKFYYQNADGSIRYRCKHSHIDEFGIDWNVYCYEGRERKRTYRVHLLINQHQRPVYPPTAFEVLYWVTDRSHGQPLKFTGNTLWFFLAKESPLAAIQLSQSVENDLARLHFEFYPHQN